MILVSLGSQQFQFNRLLQTIDDYCAKKIITEKVIAQTGYSDYLPLHYQVKDFMDRDQFMHYLSEANLVITHGGTGVIVNAIKLGKKVIAIPRLAKYGEHVDDHQLQLVEQFSNTNLICACLDLSQLDQAIQYAEHHEFASFQSSTEKLIESMDDFIKGI